jgi:hypothetical protein
MQSRLSKPRTRINLTPFCKVCRDAGKPKSVYTSHYPRENPAPGSKVVCPLLLSQTCNYCHKPGHTIRYCSVLRNNKKLKNDIDVQMHIDIEREIRIEDSHIKNQKQNPNDPNHPDTVWFPIPIIPNSGASATGQGSDDPGDDNFNWGYERTHNNWVWTWVIGPDGGYHATWTNGNGQQYNYVTPPNSPKNKQCPGAPLKRRRIENEDFEEPLAA